MTPDRFSALWRSLEPIGREPGTGGYVRYSWSRADLATREWFVEEALDRDLDVETDGNGNLWAWWGSSDAGDAVVTGSHLDSVPHGGGYDGPLGVVSGLLAIDLLRERGHGEPLRPIAVAVFTEEEGGRFGVPCLGSRLLTGALDPAKARRLRDRDGVSLAEAMEAAGASSDNLGADPSRLARIGTFVELHVEQGRALADLDRPVGVASAIWPHGRWRFTLTGEGNHAGTTAMADRHDPMLTFAYLVLAANKEARLADALATVGRVAVKPGATNAIAASVTAWLDARAPDQSIVDALVDAVVRRVAERAARDGTSVEWTAESLSPVVDFDGGLRDRLAALLGDAPVLPTGAGHDAGVLAAHVPTAMLFVRNPTGVSHAPAEWASDADCAAGVRALADVLAELAYP
ncbi:allantoate amidohydrolase [Virgisporangium aurantiacum]|uniref:Zn-dependent hydrolase n=1 Tax=Virgisporangium aurantiacum TaxID=175570 RepID=A0A8J3ZAD3_9ACTN|nr:allantoate amidohydrolase [Virgisporangium aurantiacum]GIJ57965.1 Zn-dependent hydrolase [Virgisporangium aurantiacum]